MSTHNSTTQLNTSSAHDLQRLDTLDSNQDPLVQLLNGAYQLFEQSNQPQSSIEQVKHLRQQAKHICHKVIEFKHDLQSVFADARNLLGRIALEEGLYVEAERHLDLGLKTQTEHAGLHYSKGHLFLITQQYIEALKYFNRAEDIKPGGTKAAVSIAYTLTRQGHYVEAFKAYRRLIRIHPNDDHIRAKLFECTNRIQADYYDPELEKDLIFFLQLEGADHNALANLIGSLILFKYPQTNQTFTPAQLKEFSADPLLIHALQNVYFSHVSMEILLKNIRKSLTLHGLTQNNLDDELLPLLTALVIHNTSNEYVFSYDTQEKDIITQLKELLENAFNHQVAADELAMLTLIYAMYEPLTELKNVGVLMSLKISDWPKYAQAALEHGLYNIFSEQVAARQIRRLSNIHDKTSCVVQAQYEQNPYPRWLHLNFNTPTNYGRALEHELPGFKAPDFFNGEHIKVLIAGCGTGRHALHVAKYFRNVEVTAIDLSSRALAYAKTMAKKYNITNIKFMQADILELDLLDETFHVIECSGVLHHMNDPMAGWKSLKRRLKPQGIMKVGLYSRRAREVISRSRVIIDNNGLSANKQDIRKFRDVVIHSNNEHIFGSILRSKDFFSLSGCRDMLFNAQEHCFSPDELKSMLSEMDMNFSGFVLQPSIKSAYRRIFPTDAGMRNLDNWETLEQDNPEMFTGMYQMYCMNS